MLLEIALSTILFMMAIGLFGLINGWFDNYVEYDDLGNSGEKPYEPVTIDFVAVILIAICTLPLCSVGCYTATKIDAEKLKVQYECNLNNTLTLAQNMNEKVVVRNEMDKVIVDVANLSQSSITSSVYSSYVSNVNMFNEQLAEYSVISKRTVGNVLMWGFKYRLDPEVKYIKIKL